VTDREIYKTVLSANQNNETINCAAWAHGLYFYRTEENGAVMGLGKIVVE